MRDHLPVHHDRAENGVTRFSGTPIQQHSSGETSRFRQFLSIIWPWGRKAGWLAKEAGEVATAYANAEISIREGRAAKLAAEASEIAARRDAEQQATVRQVNEELSRIFAPENDVRDEVRLLQFANLMAANPQIAEQLESVRRLYEQLRIIHGTRIALAKPIETTAANENIPAAQESPDAE